MSNNWSAPTSPAEVIARAGGRRRYNAERQGEAAARRLRMLRLFNEYGVGYGVRSRIARELGVHRSTITRDFQAVVWVHDHPCPTCGTAIEDKQWERIADERGIGIDPLSRQGREDAWAVGAIRDALPGILSDLGFYADQDDVIVTHPDIPAAEEAEVTVERLATKIAAGAFQV